MMPLVRRARIGLGRFILGKRHFFNSDASLEIDRLTEILRKAEEAMDDMERAGGDAPHRSVDLATRIRVQTVDLGDLRHDLERHMQIIVAELNPLKP